MTPRIAIVPAILLLLMQATPVLACIAAPQQPLMACCCETARDCPMGPVSGECSVPDACRVDGTDRTWYSAGVLLPALAGLIIGPRVLRW